jgi:hypothetical protein
VKRPWIATLLLVLPLGAMAEPVRVPGTKVSLDPPSGFVLSSNFPGVQDAERAASIIINELQTSTDLILDGLTKDNLLTRGMTMVSSQPAAMGGRPAVLINATQVVNGAIFEKWMGAMGDGETTILVVAAYPQALADELREELRKAVLSATWMPQAEIDPFEGLPFRVRETEGLKISSRIQNMLVLAQPDTPRAAAEPFAVVGASHSEIEIDDVELFSKQRAAQIAQITNLTDLRGSPMEFDGRPGYELTARAKDLNTGTPLVVYQSLVVDGRSYVLTQGLVGEEKSDTYLSQFRAIAASVEFH